MAKSNITGFFINRQVTNPTDTFSGTGFNRVAGADMHFYSKDNTFEIHAYIHKSITPDISSNALSSGLLFDLDKRKYSLKFKGQNIDQGFQSDLGFTKRKDILRIDPGVEYKMYPEGRIINNLVFYLRDNIYWKPSSNMKNVEYNLVIEGKINFADGSMLAIKPGTRYIYLDKEFNPPVKTAESHFPIRSDMGIYGASETNDFYILNELGGVPLPVGDYYYNDVAIYLDTDKRRDLSLGSSTTLGGYYSGKKYSTDFTLTYRVQPIFFAALKVQYDDIRLPEPHNSGTLRYLGPTLNFTFTKSIFWNTDIQYSTQSETFYMVSKVQWRYAPLSDMFLTYTDSYNIEPMTNIGRGIYFKISYWFDIRRKK